MRTRIQYSIIFIASLTIIGFTFFGCATVNQDQELASLQQSIHGMKEKSQRALDILEVQNTMSKHGYYHAASKHIEELENIWVKEDGEYAETATFGQPHMVMKGLDVIKRYYGEETLEKKKKRLEAISKIYPNVKNVPENIGAGWEWVMHTQTTPVIEIAGDGKTAKGMWYSPGIGLMPQVEDGKIELSGSLFMEMYGADFVKEDGKWKLWHLQMFYDFNPALDSDWTEVKIPEKDPKEEGMEMGAQDLLREGVIPNPNEYYESFSPIRVHKLARFPEPYYTFSETFSY